MPKTLILAALATLASGAPDGSRLREGEVCFAIVGPAARGGEVIGATRQSLRRERRGSRRIWRVVVHQRLANGRFDLRDELVLDARDLRPLTLVTTRNSKEYAAVTYGANRIMGYRTDRQGRRMAIDQPVAGPVWDGNLYGSLFAALPLAQNARFSVPFFQYDRGRGEFTVEVVGNRRVDTPQGPVEAWVLDAGPSPAERLEYLIARRDGRELGYGSADGSQRLGGDCQGLD